MTNGGGGMGHNVADIKALCPKAKFMKSLAIYDTSVRRAKEDVENWLKEIRIIK